MNIYQDNFDSKVFNAKVGKIYINTSKKPILLRKFLKPTDFKMICLYLKYKEKENNCYRLHKLLFKYITTQCTLYKKISDVTNEFDEQISEYKRHSILSLLPVVYTISGSSRIALDRRIERKFVRKYYKEWIYNSVKNKFITILNYNIKSTTCGILSIKSDDSDKAYIDLFGILPKFQNKGIGSKLLNKAENICMSKGVKHIKVITNLSNQNGLNFYLKHGFNIDKLVLVFHRYEV